MRDAVVQIVQTDIERRGSSSRTITTPITLVVASLNLRRLGAAKHATRDRLLDELGIASVTVTPRPFKGFCFGHITRRGKLCRPRQRTDGIVVVCRCVHCGVPHGRDQVWPNPSLVKTKFGQTKFGQDQVWPDQVWPRPSLARPSAGQSI